jgi:hypothetical protein
VNFSVIGNVLSAKAEGVLVTGMLGKSALPISDNKSAVDTHFKMIFIFPIS